MKQKNNILQSSSKIQKKIVSLLGLKADETERKTTKEAIEQALKKLKLTRNKVKIEILSDGTKGLFGMHGTKLAKVRVTERK